jgi:hypothetical protein
MSKLPPISAPIHRRWREFRFQYLPFIAFGLSVLGTLYLWGEFALPHHAVAPNEAQATHIIIPPSQGSIATVAPGALNTASITNPPPALSD